MWHSWKGGELRQASRKGPLWLCQGRGRKAPVWVHLEGWPGKLGRAVLWALTWWASHPCRALATSISLGANGPRRPPGTNSIWGRNVISSGLALTPTLALTPSARTYHLEGAGGPSYFLWIPVALELVVRQRCVSSRVLPQVPPGGRGQCLLRLLPPRTPVLRDPWRPFPEAHW